MSSKLTYFKQQGKRLIFMGKLLEAYIPLRYEMHNGLSISETVKTIGYFDMDIDGIPSGLQVGAIVELAPSDIANVTRDGESFLKLTFNKGDTFLVNTNYVRSSKIAYVLFYELTYGGHYPRFITHESLATIYDYILNDTDLKVTANHALFEMMASQLMRDSDNVSKLWRLTPGTKKPKILGLHNVVQISSSVTGKLTGAYMKQGFESALAKTADSTQLSEIENLLRS